MFEFVSVVGAVLSAIGAAVAWYANQQMKRYELAQARTERVLDKRFECYPDLWKRCQTFNSALKENTVRTKADIDVFCDDLAALRGKDGLYYSEPVLIVIAEIVGGKKVYDPADRMLVQALADNINGTRSKAGLVHHLRDDLGMHIQMAGAILQ